jgi:hypothetical protein
MGDTPMLQLVLTPTGLPPGIPTQQSRSLSRFVSFWSMPRIWAGVRAAWNITSRVRSGELENRPIIHEAVKDDHGLRMIQSCEITISSVAVIPDSQAGILPGKERIKMNSVNL